jgi:type II secretory pathway component PulK
MKFRKRYNRGKGMALIIILVLITAIVVVGLGFIIRGDTELLCGQNMELKADMDYLAESGLEHARGLILNPQDIDISGDCWSAAEQQLSPDSNDYYNVSVAKVGLQTGRRKQHCSKQFDRQFEARPCHSILVRHTRFAVS